MHFHTVCSKLTEKAYSASILSVRLAVMPPAASSGPNQGPAYYCRVQAFIGLMYRLSFGDEVAPLRGNAEICGWPEHGAGLRRKRDIICRGCQGHFAEWETYAELANLPECIDLWEQSNEEDENPQPVPRVVGGTNRAGGRDAGSSARARSRTPSRITITMQDIITAIRTSTNSQFARIAEVVGDETKNRMS